MQLQEQPEQQLPDLPTGVTGTWAANVVTISGTPTVAGAALTYTVTLTGGCGVITTTGTIAVTANNTVYPDISSCHYSTDSMYQYPDNQYHICNNRSNRSNSYQSYRQE